MVIYTPPTFDHQIFDLAGLKLLLLDIQQRFGHPMGGFPGSPSR